MQVPLGIMLMTRTRHFDYNNQQQQQQQTMREAAAKADLFSAMDPSSSASAGDRELQDFLAQEQQKLQFQNQVNKLTETCWDKCMTEKPSSRLDGRTETCLSNCVDRFLDTSLSIAQRFQNMLQKQISQ